MNITGSNNKILAAYTLMILLYTLLALVFVYFYWLKSISWRFMKKHSHKQKFYENDVALHTLMVTGLPTDTQHKKMADTLRNVFERLF